MLKTLLTDKPLVAAVAAFIAAAAVTVLNAIGLGAFGPAVTTAVTSAAGLVVATYLGGEAHKAATGAVADAHVAAAGVSPAAAPPAPAVPAAQAVDTAAAALAGALSQAADALTTKA